MSDIISRQAAIDAFDGTKVNEEDCTEYDIGYNDGIDFAVSKLSVLPSAEPVKHEECEYVITKGKAGYHEEYKCSVCGDSCYWTHDKMFPNRFNYCRNCGRKIVKFIDAEVKNEN